MVVLVVLIYQNSSTKLYDVTALFDVFLETNKHQHLTRLRQAGYNQQETTILTDYLLWQGLKTIEKAMGQHAEI